MKYLKLAICPSVREGIITEYDTVDVHNTDFTNVGAVVVSVPHARKIVEKVKATGFGIPIFIALQPDEQIPERLLPQLDGVLQLGFGSRHYYGKQVEAAADQYAENLAPPFFGTLKKIRQTRLRRI